MQFSKLLFAAAGLLLGGVAFATLTPFTQSAPAANEHHKMITAGVGEWAGTLEMIMPGMPSMTVPCTESVTALGDFWTISSFNAEFFGVDFEGSYTYGYDVTTKSFVGTWIDNQHTNMSVMSGTFDKDLGAVVMTYKGNSMSGGLVDMRSETVVGEGTVKSNFYEIVDGKKNLVMVTDMKRVAESAEPVNAGTKLKAGKVIKKAGKTKKPGKVKIGGNSGQ